MLSWEFPPNLVGGLSRHVDNLSRALVGRGVEVDVLTTSYPGAPPLEEIGGVRVHRVPPYFSNAPDFPSWVMHANFGFLEEGARLVGANGPADLVHAHDWLVTYAARGLKHLYQVPLVATIHATEHGRHNGVHSPQQKYINDIEWWLTYEAWRVISCSGYMKDEIRRLFGLPDDKVRVVPNGVTLPVGSGKGDRSIGTSRPRSHFAHPAEKIIFHVGRLVPEKGTGLLLEALPMILAVRPEVKLVIAGTGPWAEELRYRARAAGIEPKVYLTGFLDDATISALYRWAEVAVFPSYYEPFGIVALEGMAAGTPVVVSDVGGLSEIVKHDVDGLKALPGNARSLADQILRILGEPGLRERLARAALDKIRRGYLWERVAALTEKVYQEVLDERSRTTWAEPKPVPAGVIPIGRYSEAAAPH